MLLGSITILTYGRSDYTFYLSWLGGLSIILFYLLERFRSSKIKTNWLMSNLVMLLWITYSLSITAYSLNPTTHLKYLIVTTFYVIFSNSFISWLMAARVNLNKFFTYFSVLWLVVNTVYLVLYLLGKVSFETGSFSGVFQNRNIFAVLTVFLFGFNLFLVYPNSTQKNKLKYLLSGLAFFVIVSLSIKGIIGLTLFFVVYFLLLKPLRKEIVFYPLIAVLIMVPFLVIDNPIKDRIARFTNDKKELKISESSFERKWLRTEGGKIINTHPLTGIGVNNSTMVLITPYRQYLIEQGRLEYNSEKPGTYSHSNYIEMGLNGGYPAIALYYLPLLFVLFILCSNRFNDPKLYKIKVFLIVITTIKLIIDYAMVSYYDLTQVLMYSVILQLFFSILREKNKVLNEN